MSIEDFFYSTVNIEEPAATKDDIGGRTLTWTARHTALRCCIQPRSGNEAEYYGREAARTTHVMYCRHSDVSGSLPQEDWRAVSTSHPSDGTYNIRNVRNIDEANDFMTIEIDETE